MSALNSGVALAEVRDVLGHTTVAMPARYAHLAPENLRTVVAAMERVRSRFGHGAQARKRTFLPNVLIRLVELRGIEPLTSALRTQRSPS